MSDSTKPIPVLDHVFAIRRLRRGSHKIFKVTLVCIFKNDTVRLMVVKTSVISDDEWRRLSVNSEPYESLALSVMLLLCIRPSICLEYKGLLKMRRTLLKCHQRIEALAWGLDRTGISQRGGTNLLYSSWTLNRKTTAFPPSPISSLFVIGSMSSL